MCRITSPFDAPPRVTPTPSAVPPPDLDTLERATGILIKLSADGTDVDDELETVRKHVRRHLGGQ
jgi:hypothetical protein